MATTATPEYGWWAGNSRFVSQSGKWLSAHIAQYALITFWAGGITLFELARYNPEVSMGEQGLILIPHLATLGWGVGSGGQVVDTYPYFVIGVIHLVASAVFGAGALYHALKGPADLSKSDFEFAKNFHFEWDDAAKLGNILGHHLLTLGYAALLFVIWIRFHGVYDATIGEVRVVSNPGATILSVLFEYGWFTPDHNPYFVNNLEDLLQATLISPWCCWPVVFGTSTALLSLGLSAYWPPCSPLKVCCPPHWLACPCWALLRLTSLRSTPWPTPLNSSVLPSN